jgi:hypothetical protein
MGDRLEQDGSRGKLSGHSYAGSARLALSPSEAAASVGVSLDFFDEHVRPELRIVRRGRRVLVPIRELERWLDREGVRVLDQVNGHRF